MAEYDEFGEAFSQTRKHPWPEFDFLFPLLKKGDRLLDLGCGNARLRDSLPYDKVPEGNYFGLDISEVMLQIARHEYPREHFFRANFARELPFGNENFDVITAVASFHHLLTPKHQDLFMQEVSRILKPGGYLFLTTWKLPQKYMWPNLLQGRFKNWIIPFGDAKDIRTYRRVTDKDMKKLLKKYDFEILQADLYKDRNYIAIGKKR